MTNDFTEQSFSEKMEKRHYFENEENKFFERLKKRTKRFIQER